MPGSARDKGIHSARPLASQTHLHHLFGAESGGPASYPHCRLRFSGGWEMGLRSAVKYNKTKMKSFSSESVIITGRCAWAGPCQQGQGIIRWQELEGGGRTRPQGRRPHLFPVSRPGKPPRPDQVPARAHQLPAPQLQGILEAPLPCWQ